MVENMGSRAFGSRRSHDHSDSQYAGRTCEKALSQLSSPSTSGQSAQNSRIRRETSLISSSNRFGDGPRRPTSGKRAEALWAQVLHLLDTEWREIRSLNLGVKSGTAVLNDLILRRAQSWLQELHTLCVTSEQAAGVLAALARRLSREQLQQLQVLLDVTDHSDLADYIRLCVYNTSHPFATRPVDVVDMPVAVRMDAPDKHKKELVKSMSLPSAVAPDRARVPPPAREEFLRFAGYLRQDHPLVQRAYRLYLSRLPPDPQGKDANGKAGDRASFGLSQASLGRLGGRGASGPSLLEEAGLVPTGPSTDNNLPLWGDVEQHWRRTTHTVVKDDEFNSILISDTAPPYTSLPEFKRKFLVEQQQKQAAAMAPEASRLPAPPSPTNTTRVSSKRLTPARPSFRASPLSSRVVPVPTTDESAG